VSGVYKIIFKVLADKLKSVLRKIISNSHNAFIDGRQILDLVLIVDECFYSQIRSGESVLCKLDLENGYDCKLGVLAIFVEEMWIWGEIEGLDSTLYYYGAVFHSY
jgi:hypothetical protein